MIPANDNAQVIYLQKHKVERMLEEHSAQLVVFTALCDLPKGVRPIEILNVGHAISPPMLIETDDEYLTCLMHFGGVAHGVVIPWRAVLRSEPYYPPQGSGGAPIAMVA